MLNAEQIEHFKADPKEFLAQYKYLDLLAQYHVSRLELFSDVAQAKDYCKIHSDKAHEALALKSDIEALIDNAGIKAKYKEVLRLRFIEGLQLKEIIRLLYYTDTRWTEKMIKKALGEIARAI